MLGAKAPPPYDGRPGTCHRRGRSSRDCVPAKLRTRGAGTSAGAPPRLKSARRGDGARSRFRGRRAWGERRPSSSKLRSDVGGASRSESLALHSSTCPAQTSSALARSRQIEIAKPASANQAKVTTRRSTIVIGRRPGRHGYRFSLPSASRIPSHESVRIRTDSQRVTIRVVPLSEKQPNAQSLDRASKVTSLQDSALGAVVFRRARNAFRRAHNPDKTNYSADLT